MANTSTIKQRFIDILFESDEEEIEKSLNEKRITNEIKDDTPIKASDILYAKKQEKEANRKNTFINIEIEDVEEKKVEKKEEYSKDEFFSPSPNLSPIFGNIENPKKKTKTNSRIVADYAAVEKPSSNYLGMVLSPIYGYDSITANKARASLADDKSEKIKNSDVIEELDIFDTYEYKNGFDIEEEAEKTTEINLFDDLKEED